MSILSTANYQSGRWQPAEASAPSAKNGTASDSGSNSTSTASNNSGSSSSEVSLSPTAQVLAELSAQGITLTVPGGQSLSQLSLPALSAGEDPMEAATQVGNALAEQGCSYSMTLSNGLTISEEKIPQGLPPMTDPNFMTDLNNAMQQQQNVTPPTARGVGVDGTISESSFESVAAQFGATKQQADNLFGLLDSDGNSTLSNSQLLAGIAQTAKDPGSASSQALLQMLDGNGTGVVSASQLVNFETQMVAAEKAPSSAN